MPQDEPSYKMVARDTLGMKRETDDIFLTFSERLLKGVPMQFHPPMNQIDALVDDCAGENIKCVARYVKRQLRRCGVSTDEIGGRKPSEVDTDGSED